MNQISKHDPHIISQLPALPVGGLSRAAQILPLLPFKRTTLWNFSKTGKFPKPIKINGVTAWKNSEVLAWLKNQGMTDEGDI